MKGLPPTLTFAVSAPIVTYGQQATLSGVVSNHRAGEQVVIYYQPYPQPNLIQRAVLLTTTGGAFSFLVEPQILTTYEAAWKGAYATPTSIEVVPKLTLGRNNGWIIHASGGRSFAGRAVQLQRLNAATGQWVTLRKVLLNTKSSTRVLYTLPKGMNHLRVTMSVNQAGAGFLGAISTDRQLQPAGVVSARRSAGALSPRARSYRRADLVPVDDVPPRGEVVGAAVLVLEVVGVLPDVDAEERHVVPSISGLSWFGVEYDRERRAVPDEPGPAGAEALHAGVVELRLERRRSRRTLSSIASRERAARLAAAARAS